ncbi:GroES-like protein [Lindgomyces ingoldianus]|uniref:GroES-like protein n=1 Tax=Lindgomyces ingoldianus TaxID=673940 RepID=A0ACB6R200_9PLEO|nr:GroES-like protein [Lindgomyces ingoldianus]KAF2473344.1 GroES-like protein [Lindgomyces ingoldianus]
MLVQVIASGVCYTDLAMSMVPAEYGLWPKVLGHEGGGIIEKMGSKITHTKPGDLVLVSFDYCGETTCYNCSNGRPGYCPTFEKNITMRSEVYKLGDGKSASGALFCQSSFSNLALSGVGAVTKLANVKETDSVAVFGLGGVGMLALMAAKIRDCYIIVGVDRVQFRLDMAKSVGVTHVINTFEFQDLQVGLTQAIKDICKGGTSCNVDTTGVLDIIHAGGDLLDQQGQLILTIRRCIEGSALPKTIPQLIQWYRVGKLPVDKLLKQYAADDFETPLEDMHTKATIKPILIW